MIKEKRERLKTLILILLIITSVIQIGIHWNNQTQGLPFHFITQLFNANGKRGPRLDVDLFKEQYFKPAKIIVSISTTHFRLEEWDSQFTKVWQDVRDNYIPAMIKQRPNKIIPKEQWAAITSGRCVRIDFDLGWPGNIVYLLEEVRPGEAKSFEGIQSIVIVPQADVNETVNIAYVYDGIQIYQYQIDVKKEFLPKSYYSNLESVSKNKPGLRLLSAVSNFVSDKDIYVSLERGKGRSLNTVSVQIPDSIVLNRSNMENDSIQENILLNQKESFSANHLEGSNYAMFTDTEHLYRLFDNGVLEYRYIPANTAQAGEISTAFKHAVTFLEQRRHLVGEAEIMLTKIENKSNYYEMQFSYKAEGAPIYYSVRQEDRISPPITIKANSERIIECKWVIRSFNKESKLKSYNVDFADLINEQIIYTYPEIIESENKHFDRIEPGYIFRSSDTDGTVLDPSWIISTDSKDYFIPLSEMGG